MEPWYINSWLFQGEGIAWKKERIVLDTDFIVYIEDYKRSELPEDLRFRKITMRDGKTFITDDLSRLCG